MSAEMANDGPAGSLKTRTRVSQACKICSFKKIKCGGELPRCKTCTLHDRDCVYGVSKRNTRLNLMRPLPGVQDISSPSFSPQSGGAAAFAFSSNPVVAASAPSLPHHHVAVSSEESARLFQTYFACIHPIWPLLYKPLYNSIGYHQLAYHLSKSVVYAIYAVAACLPSSADEPSSLEASQLSRPTTAKPREFFDAALNELQNGGTDGSDGFLFIHALKPSIAHCQTLVILSLQQHGLAEFSRAGILCGLASAMAIDLRLHRNYWLDDPIQKEVCSRLWWNIYILEKMMSFEMGRPITLRMEETDTPYPSEAESDEFELFTPMIKIKSMSNQGPVKIRTLSAFATTIEMCKIMEHVSREVYSLGARESIRLDRVAGDLTRIKIWATLQRWREETDKTPLRLDLSRSSITLPTMITNYVTTECASILLHRPFIAYWLQQVEQTGQPPFLTPDPSAICYQAAKQICVILEAYSEYLPQLPCDLIFPIFTAASTLLHESRQSTTDSVDNRRQLRLCLYWLSIFGNNWKSAGERQKMFNELAELPTQLNAPRDARDRDTRFGSGTQELNTGFPSNLPITTPSGFSDILTTVDDWGFLDVFGDADDNFYAMDAEFRHILERQHEASVVIATQNLQ